MNNEPDELYIEGNLIKSRNASSMFISLFKNIVAITFNLLKSYNKLYASLRTLNRKGDAHTPLQVTDVLASCQIPLN